MNAIDFGIIEDRDVARGACMWAGLNEWCGAPTVVTDYDRNQRFNPPTGYRYGARYGLVFVEVSKDARDTMWICDEHRVEFLNNAAGKGRQAVWQFDWQGKGELVNMKRYTVEIMANYTVDAFSHQHAERLGVELAKTSTSDEFSIRVDELDEDVAT